MLLEIKVVMFLSLKVYFIFLKVSQEFERTGKFLVLLEYLGEFLDALYFFGLSFDEENNLVSENPFFYFFSPFYFEENWFDDSS